MQRDMDKKYSKLCKIITLYDFHLCRQLYAENGLTFSEKVFHPRSETAQEQLVTSNTPFEDCILDNKHDNENT